MIVKSFLLTLLLILILYPIAITTGLIDQPCNRKQHDGKIPLIGGISLYLCILLLFYWLPIQNYAYLTAATLIVSCGIIDDIKNLCFKKRLLIEVFCALIMIYWGNVEITSLGNLLGFGEIQLGQYSPLFTVFCFVGGINAFNMIDGIDGLAGSLSIIVLSLIFLSSYQNPEITLMYGLLAPAIIAFLLFNLRIFHRKQALIFLGDTGSMLLGFTISFLVIIASQGTEKTITPVTILWIIALPLMDAVAIMLRRFKKGHSPFKADREHLHHILPLMGYSINQTVAILSLLCLSFGLFGILNDKFFKLPEWLMFYLFISIFILYYKLISKVFQPEDSQHSIKINATQPPLP